MYLSYYKLNKKPFQISTDPKFLWLGKKHQKALSILKYGIDDDKGFLLLTGGVGTGKTTVLNAFVNSLEEDIIVARVSDPGLTKLDFMKFVAQKFGIDTDFQTKSEFLILFTTFLEQADKDNKKVLLIIDEAQLLTDEVLEEIRLLSNIENQDKKLLNIFLVGQDEFNSSLEKYENRALRQRITINYTLNPLEPEETKACIEYRLGVAGCQTELFTPEAITAIHTLSEGFPRVINIVCDHALFHGCEEQQAQITDETIWEISKDLQFSHMPQTFQKPDFSDSLDDDWLEASEVPPLSIEAIQKASQPLPDPRLELTEEPRKKTQKYRVATVAFILVFLLSGFLVLDESKVESITQFVTDLYKGTITPHLQKKSTPKETPVFSQENQITKVEEAIVESANPQEVSSEVIHLNDQKKTLPEESETSITMDLQDETSPEYVEDDTVIDSDQPKNPVIQMPETAVVIDREQPQIALPKSPTNMVSAIPEDTTISSSTSVTAEKNPVSNKIKKPTPVIEDNVTSIVDTAQADSISTGEELTDETKDTVEKTPAIKQQVLPTVTQEESAGDENMLLPTVEAKPEEAVDESSQQTIDTVTQKPQPPTTELQKNNSANKDVLVSPTVKAEPQNVEQTLPSENVSREIVTQQPPQATPEAPAADVEATEIKQDETTTLVVEENSPSPKPNSVVEKTLPDTQEPEVAPEQREPSTPEDPGAVIDWLLESNKTN